jgi:type I restriction enzyme S subunit
MKLEGNTGARFDRLAISDAQFFNMPIIVPKQEKEQIAVADFFSNLDKQIDLQTQRLEKLKQIKSACLDNMFV